MTKRDFLKTSLGISSMPLFQYLAELTPDIETISPLELAKDEDFWAKIRAGYRLKPDYINLENGYYCHIPEETLNNYITHAREINYQASWYMRTVQWDNKTAVANRLAKLVDCEEGTVIITRNTTESLDTIIAGFPWKEGDEAVYAEQDYGSRRQMFKQVAQQGGIKNRVV
ncbi:MAG: aminotransferase class V-fold PLP-dependent enzyme, partial [Saprospiraceae bacterium]